MNRLPTRERIILAALDRSATAGPVLDAARAVALLLGASLQAVHVVEDGVTTIRELTEAARVPLRLLQGAPEASLISVLEEDDVLLAVLGIRREPDSRQAIGRIALQVVQQASKPVIAVPPGYGSREPIRFSRLLVPLDGTVEVARAMERPVRMLGEAGVQALALHVFDQERIPRFSDQPQHEVNAWEREFLARYFSQPGARLQTRRGWASSAILEVAQAERADMVALGWRQDLSVGSAAVVRELLTRSTVPIILVPLAQDPETVSPDAGLGGGRDATRN